MLRTTRRAAWLGAVMALPLAVAAVPASAFGADGQDAGLTYYVSVQGADDADGLSPEHSFASIQRCADVMVAGDTCIIGSGTYRETITPAASGTASAPITYQAAPGARVVIDGTSAVDGFEPVTDGDLAAIVQADPYAADSLFSDAVAAGNVYATQVDLGDEPAEVQVFTDRTMDIEASWPFPGTDLLDPVIERAGEGTAEATIVDDALTHPAGYWDDARILTSYWYITTTGTVASSDVGSVTLDVAPVCVHKVVPTDTWYRLSGKIGELGHEGSYFYDAATQMLYLYSEDDPDAHTVEVKERELAFDLSGISHTNLSDLGIFASTIITDDASTGVSIDGLDGKYLNHYWDVTQGTTNCGENVTRGVGDTGIVLKGTDNSVTNSTIQYSAGNGVALRGYGNTVSNTTITDVDYAGSYAAPVAVQGHSQTVVHNTFARVGRSGINLQWNGVEGTTPGPDRIAYNDISGYASLSVDTAAIYACCTAWMEGTQIDHNVLHDPNPREGGVYPFGISGIYADNGTSDLRIHNNVGWGNHEGTVELNGLGSCSCDNLVYNNTGGMTLFYVKGENQSVGSQVINNIGHIQGLDGATDGGILIENNLLEEDPLFVDPAANDYRLQAGSPARMTGEELPPYTDGSTDAVPSMGAYQYGAPLWEAGVQAVEPAEDTTRPETTLVSPSSAGPVNELLIHVDASDDVGLRRIVANIYADGVLVQSTQTQAGGATSATHTATVSLPDGAYTVRYNSQDEAGNISRTREVTVRLDSTAPRVTVKGGSGFTMGDAEAGYEKVSFKLFDAGQIDRFELNSVARDLSNNAWSDINFVQAGRFGAVAGENTLVVYDVAGNATTVTFTLG